MNRKSKFSTIPWRLHLLVGTVGSIVIGIVIYGFYIGERLNRFDEPLIDAVRELQLEAAAADLWFEEFIQGNIVADLKTIWEPLDQSAWYLRAILQERKTGKQVFKPFEEVGTHEQISHIQKRLTELKESVALIVASTDPSAAGRRLRQQYDQKMTEFLDSVKQFEGRLLDIKARNLRYFRYIHLILLTGCFLLFLAISIAFQFFTRQRTKDYQALRETKQRLETENEERIRAEIELQKSQSELEERVYHRTSELSAANQKLQAEIQERNRVELQLSQSQSMLQGVFNGISDPLMLVDRNMTVKMMNKSAVAYYNIGKYPEVIGKRCYEAVGKSGLCDGCQIPGAVFNGLEKMFERNGFMDSERIEQVTIYSAAGNGEGSRDSIIRINDITETRLFERHLRQSEKMASLGILVSSVAHEINNPNNWVTFNIPILKNYIEALLPIVDQVAAKSSDLEFCNMSYPDFRQDMFKLMDNIQHGAERINSFVADLRGYSRSNDRRVKKYIDFEAVIEKAVVICRSKLERSVKSLEVKLPNDLPPVYTDPYAMEQVLINLLLNAAQAADKKDSWVKLFVKTGNSSQEQLIVEVIDNGCGIDESSRAHIFDPFYTTKPPGSGTGLGLYICHNLIQGLGGRLEVKSSAASGSTFTVILPDKDSEERPL